MNHIVLAGFHTVLALQGGPASVTGVIRDADAGSVISGAIVSLPELNRTTASDADGRYTIAAVPAGPHHISVRKIGYAARTLHAFVPVSGTLEINVSILLLPVAERLATVVVRRPVEVGRSSGGDAISPADETTSIAAIRNNPLLTQPDVLQSLSGGEISVKHEAPGGVHIRGGASDHTSYVLDGIPVFSPYHTAGIFGAWNPDALSHVAVTSAMPSFAHPGTLSGTIAAVTRNSGPRLSTRGSISSTHTGVTLDGPLGIGDAAFLASVRFAYPHLTAWTDDPTYVQGASGDRLLKLDIPAIGGQLKLVGYHSTNEISTASETDAEAGGGAVRGRNTFEWQSQSLGFAWSRAFSTTRVNLIGWSAAIDAESRWKGRMSPLVMTAGRFEQGAVLLAVKTFARSTVTAGGRFESNRNSYVVRFDSGALAQFRIAGRQPLVAAFTNYSAAIGNRAHVDFGSSAALAGGAIRLSPQAQLRWTHSDRLASSAGFARTHQFSQSLRNPESVTAGIFPADLFAGAGPAAFPVARSDLGVVSATYRPTADTRIAVQAWERRFNNLLLVAPFDDEPFATRPIGFGGGRARGASAEASVGSKRYGLTASYGIQRVRYYSGPLEYVPDHGPAHLLEGGLIFFPSATSSIRFGVAHSAGRRTTAVGGQFEWESCNLKDGGCEFSGSPRANGEPLGQLYLPAYLRFDTGIRKHWHADIGGLDATITLFGALTNVFDRNNILTYTRDPATGTLLPVDLRPRAPLVVGLEWQI